MTLPGCSCPCHHQRPQQRWHWHPEECLPALWRVRATPAPNRVEEGGRQAHWLPVPLHHAEIWHPLYPRYVSHWVAVAISQFVERSDSGVELPTLDYEILRTRVRILAVVLKPWASFFTLHCSSSHSWINEYLAIDSGGYVYEQPSCINCSIWLDASQGSRDGVWVNRSVREVKCKVLWTVLRTGYCTI